jgi:hypothetical protein
MLERTDAITNGVLEPIRFVLAYPTVYVRDSDGSVTRTARRRIAFSQLEQLRRDRLPTKLRTGQPRIPTSPFVNNELFVFSSPRADQWWGSLTVLSTRYCGRFPGS